MTLRKDPRSADNQFYTQHAIGEALGFDFESVTESTFRSQIAEVLGIPTQDGGHGVAVSDLITMVNHALGIKEIRNEDFEPSGRILTWDTADWLVPERAYIVERRTDFFQPFVDGGMVTERRYVVPADTVAVALTPVTAAGNALRKEFILSPIEIELRGTFETMLETDDPRTVTAVVSGHTGGIVYEWGIAGGIGAGFVELSNTRTNAVTITPLEVFAGATEQEVRIFLNVRDGDGHRANAEFHFRLLDVPFDFDIDGPPMAGIREGDAFNYGYTTNRAAPRPGGRFTSSWRFIPRTGGPVLGTFDGSRFQTVLVPMNESGEVEATVSRERATGDALVPFLPVDTVTKRQTVFVIDDPPRFNLILGQTVRPGEARVVNLAAALHNPHNETVSNWRASERDPTDVLLDISASGVLTITGQYVTARDAGHIDFSCEVGGVTVEGTFGVAVEAVELSITGPTSINEGTSQGQLFRLSTNIWDINAVASSVWSVDGLPLQILSQTRSSARIRTQLTNATVDRAVTITVVAGSQRRFTATRTVRVVDVPPSFSSIPAITLDPGENRNVDISSYINLRPGETTRNWRAAEQPSAPFNGNAINTGSIVTVRAGHPANGSSSGFVAVAVEVGSPSTGYVTAISEFRVTVRQWTVSISGSTLDLPDTNPARSYTALTNSRQTNISWRWSVNVPTNVAVLLGATSRTVRVDPQNVSNDRMVRLTLTGSFQGNTITTDIRFTITDQAPARPANARTSGVQWRQVNLLWNPGTGGGPVSRYEYRVLLSPGGFRSWTSSGLSRNVLVSFLDLSQTPGGRNFRWQVRAVASNGEVSGILEGPSLTVPAEPRPQRASAVSLRDRSASGGWNLDITATIPAATSSQGRTRWFAWRVWDGSRWGSLMYEPASASTSSLGSTHMWTTFLSDSNFDDGDTIRVQVWSGNANSTRPTGTGTPTASLGWSGFREQSLTL